MDNYYKKNINNLNINNFKISNIYCNYFLKKNGKIIYIPKFFLQYFICIINKKIFAEIIQFPYIYGKDEDNLIKHLLLLNYIKLNYNLKYIKLYNDKNDNHIYLYNSDIKGIEDVIINLLFYKDILIKNKNIKQYFTGNLIKLLTTQFMILKKSTKLSNKDILIRIFYQTYIKSDEINNLLKKYNKNINVFSNYNQLYIFLKKYGYVNKFYHIYAPKIINKYNIFYKKIINDKRINQYKIKKMKEIINFKDVDLIKIIDININNKFNKKYIKNKFIELTKKYNIK